MNKTTTTVRMLPDRSLERKTDDGWVKIEIPKARPNPNVDEPAYDLDNPPLTEAQLAGMKRISPAKALRFRLGLSQQEFAARYQIPIGTLRDWEQHRSEPDAPARAYLKVVAADPEGVAEKLEMNAV